MDELIERVVEAMRDVPLTNMSDQFSDDPVHRAKLGRAAIIATLEGIKDAEQVEQSWVGRPGQPGLRNLLLVDVEWALRVLRAEKGE